MNKDKTLAITGLRRHKLCWDNYNINEEKLINFLIDKLEVYIADGYMNFLCGMASGTDMIFAKAIVRLKGKYGIMLQAIIPFKNHSFGLSYQEKKEYDFLLEHCDIVRILSNEYFDNVYKNRNKYLVENCSVLFAVTDDINKFRSGTTQTINMAKELNIEIFQINQKDFSFNKVC